MMANAQILNQIKGNNWGINDANLIKLYVHHHVMMIPIQLKFHENLFICNLVTTEFVILILIQGQ